ncbi:hypothetical protein CCACVL1_16288 [Corchorus capsularis]|uniref:TF-B3 domain-containing protein n=1 Tax=Corchorus capsularis TaxID=210143 RepID=A0A1R3HYB1_COCAP|nr:hypothetical protein CCACVL1_16288 [Corchorus capsularis]
MPQKTVVKLFSKSLTETDTNKRLAIPTKILPLLPDFRGTSAVKIQLIYGTKEWPIVCTIRKNGHKKPVFSHGWREFVRCNNLNAGDQVSLYRVLKKDETETGGSVDVYYMIDVKKPTRACPILPESAFFTPSPKVDDGPTLSVSLEDPDPNQLPDAPMEEEELAATKAHVMAVSSDIPYYYMSREERQINYPFGLASVGAAAALFHGTSQAYNYDDKSSTRLSLDLVLGRQSQSVLPPPKAFSTIVDLQFLFPFSP